MEPYRGRNGTRMEHGEGAACEGEGRGWMPVRGGCDLHVLMLARQFLLCKRRLGACAYPSPAPPDTGHRRYDVEM